MGVGGQLKDLLGYTLASCGHADEEEEVNGRTETDTYDSE